MSHGGSSTFLENTLLKVILRSGDPKTNQKKRSKSTLDKPPKPAVLGQANSDLVTGVCPSRSQSPSGLTGQREAVAALEQKADMMGEGSALTSP